MPKTLHAELAARSEASGVSLNQYIVAALTRAVTGEVDGAPAKRPLPRSVRLALVVNAIVVAVAAATAIVVLVVGVK
jgi:hypothetical protein